MLNFLIVIHFVSGAIGLLSGFVVIALTKGNKTHKRIGQVYFYSMLLLGVSGVIVAATRSIPLSLLNGLVICYFVLTSLQTIRFSNDTLNIYDKILTGLAWIIVLGFGAAIMQVTASPTGKLGGFGLSEYIAFGTVMLLSAVSDIRYLLTNGLSKSQRLVRHIWRMFFPLFMSTAAFFLGQAKLFPAALQKIELLIAPVIIVMVAMVYWVVKTSYKNKKLRAN